MAFIGSCSMLILKWMAVAYKTDMAGRVLGLVFLSQFEITFDIFMPIQFLSQEYKKKNPVYVLGKSGESSYELVKKTTKIMKSKLMQ